MSKSKPFTELAIASATTDFTPGRGVSLGGRIVLINVVAMLLVIGGLFYFGRYMDRLISGELETLTKQAQLIATTVAEVAVEATPEGDTLNKTATERYVRRMFESADIRLQVFSAERDILADSKRLGPSGRQVEVSELAAPNTRPDPRTLGDWLDSGLNWLVSVLPYHHNVRIMPREGHYSPQEYSDVIAALKGQLSHTLWRGEHEELIITVSVPVRRVQQVVGAVMLTRGSEEISNAVRELRLEILRSFSVVLLISILLSLYLAQTIARPLKKLARASLRARTLTEGAPIIPDFTERGDEIGDLSQAMRLMVKALWDRLDGTEKFAADVSHELKNPLTSMKSALETLERVADPDQRQRLLAIIKEDVRRMDRLITDIASASRLEAELSRDKSETINLVELISQLVASRNHVMPKDLAPLDFKTDAAQIKIRGVTTRIVQVMENLISNALSFSPPDKPVTIRVQARTGHALISVADSGPGIPPDKFEKIFERFYSSRPAGEQFGTHSGLGLSISRQIIEGHGGRIFAETQPEGGAKFTVELPLIN